MKVSIGVDTEADKYVAKDSGKRQEQESESPVHESSRLRQLFLSHETDQQGTVVVQKRLVHGGEMVGREPALGRKRKWSLLTTDCYTSLLCPV